MTTQMSAGTPLEQLLTQGGLGSPRVCSPDRSAVTDSRGTGRDIVVNVTIHRLVEQQAAVCGDVFAYLDGQRALTYRDLNARANALARALVACGFKRGAVAAIRMPTSAELAVTLLGVLKAGGAYRLFELGDERCPEGISSIDDHEEGLRFRPLEVMHVLDAEPAPSPNLPILTRGGDIACVLMPAGAGAAVLVPHSTIAALRQRPLTDDVQWSAGGDPLDLWMALMTGATVTVTDAPLKTVAA